MIRELADICDPDTLGTRTITIEGKRLQQTGLERELMIAGEVHDRICKRKIKRIQATTEVAEELRNAKLRPDTQKGVDDLYNDHKQVLQKYNPNGHTSEQWRDGEWYDNPLIKVNDQKSTKHH